MNPIVSIIIPCYNAAEFLEETISSVLAQTFEDWEVVLINDGSTDNTEKICLKLCTLSEKIRYLYQINSGVCEARNKGIMLSKGEYILCLDADDLISKNFLEETVTLFNRNPNLAVVTSKVEFFGRSNGKLNVKSYSLDVILAQNQLVITSLFKRKDFFEVGGFNINMREGFEDWDFWISILKRNNSIQRSENAIFYYRLLSKSRNRLIDSEREKKLRYQLWINHKELYSQYFVDPLNSFEYLKISNSPEFKIGILLFAPVRKIISYYLNIKFYLHEIFFVRHHKLKL